MTLRLPDVVHALRLDPMSAPGRFQLNSISLQPIGRVRAASRLVQPVLRRMAANPSLVPAYLSAARRIAGQSGARAAIRHLLRERAFESSSEDYDGWVRMYDTLSAADVQAIRARIDAFDYRPLISVAVPVFNTPERILRQCLDSVLGQVYPRWELCLADDASSDDSVRTICERYAAKDQRIKFVRRESRGHIAAATNSALELASGEFVALLDHDDELAPHALYMIAEALNENRALDLLFSDEDKIDAKGKRFDPWFKSDWNYDLMLSQNAVVHLSAFRRSLLREIGGLRTGFDGSQDYDLLLRFSERTRPERIKHLPFVLYHWRAIEGSVALKTTEKTYPYEAAAKAIQQHLDRIEAGATVSRDAHEGYYRVKWPLPAEPPLVSLIIPTRDKVDLLKTAVDSIRTKTAYPNFQIVIVDNGSELEETKQYLSHVSQLASVCVLEYAAPFSFAALNNWAVRQPQVNTPLIGFVNNDIEVISPGWLTEMVSHALRPGVGAVGAKLYYPDETIQHAGIIVGLGGLAGHPHARFPRNTPGYFGRAVCTQQYSAVSAGCMLMQREVFLAVGGFDETNFRVAFNDVDLGLRLHAAGYSVVWTPHAELFHHESASLGLPSGRDRRELFEKESANLRSRWEGAVANDPYYNPNLTISGGDFRPCFPPRIQKPWRR
ncbi:MAG TPA: glycosyltransferase family 2 protein [Vicinamibacterales bacterium]